MDRLFVYKVYLFSLVVIFSLPFSVSASVKINEIAWMGTAKNSRAEWIELKNTSTKTVDLSGWSLVAKDGAPDIVFTKGLYIKPNSYFLLERTRNNLIDGIVADVTYKKSLSNSGEDLVLRNSDSKIVDSVASGKDWCLVGGDNTTKKTAQLTSTGWITATSTPRTKNATVGVKASCSKKIKNTQKTKASSVTSVDEKSNTPLQAIQKHIQHKYGKVSYLPVQKVFLDIGKDRSVTAGVDTRFSAIAYNAKGKVYPEPLIHFAFGDGSESDSPSVFKNYNVPGKYLVSATAVYGLGSGESSVVVTVHRALVKIYSVDSNGISVSNNSKYKLDLSLWKLKSGLDTFIFPSGTMILPNTTVLFLYKITKLKSSNNVELLYPNDKIATPYSAKIKRSILKPNTAVAGSNNRQGNSSEKIRNVSVNKIKTHEDTTILAPAKSAKVEFAGAHVGLPAVVIKTIPENIYNEANFRILLIAILSVLVMVFAVL